MEEHISRCNMSVSFTYKYSSCALEYIPNDVSIKLISFLVDSNGQLYIDPNTLAIDTFTVQLYKSSLPSSNYASYLSIIANNAVRTKYSTSIGGYSTSGSKYITQITSTSGLLPGLFVYGTGIPVDTVLQNIRDTASIELSQETTTTGSISLTLSTSAWAIDYSALTTLAQTVNFANL